MTRRYFNNPHFLPIFPDNFLQYECKKRRFVLRVHFSQFNDKDLTFSTHLYLGCVEVI